MKHKLKIFKNKINLKNYKYNKRKNRFYKHIKIKKIKYNKNLNYNNKNNILDQSTKFNNKIKDIKSL